MAVAISIDMAAHIMVSRRQQLTTTSTIKATRGDNMNSLPDWAEGFDQEKVERAVSAGEILPRLPLPSIPAGKTASDETLFVKALKNPYKVEPDGRDPMYVMDVEHQGARKNLIVPDSLRFGFLKEMKLHKLSTLVGHYFVIGAHLQDTKHGKGQKLYWCQLKVRKDEVQEQPSEQPAQAPHSTEQKSHWQEAKPESPKAEEKKEAPAASSAPQSRIDEIYEGFT
jgi:hypothetical protein